jgi:integrase/recombinase XerD
VAEKSRTELLFCTMDGYPLTQNNITLLFRRLRTRAGMPEMMISPRLLRQSFALRYLQAGGNPRGLQELFGYAGRASVKPYLRWYEQGVHDHVQKSVEEAVGEAMCHPEAGSWQPQAPGEEEATRVQTTVTSAGVQTASLPNQKSQESNHTTCPAVSRLSSRQRHSTMTIERAIQEFVEAQSRRKRRPKTLEWHQAALALLQQYLQQECQCVFVDQITQVQVQSWFTFVQETPTTRETKRAAGTVESYARSARAFCRWLVSRRLLKRTPFAGLQMPTVESSLPHLLEPQEWEGLLQACRSPREKMPGAEQATARNQALLWVLIETGIRASEVCGLRLGDVDREQGLLWVRGRGSRARWVPLKQEGLRHLLVYIDHYRLEKVKREPRKRVREEPLFVSETGRPLTENGIALLFGRLRKRAGITRKEVNPTLLRESFAVRYLRTGGDLFTLRELLGQEESAVVKRSLQIREKVFGERKE